MCIRDSGNSFSQDAVEQYLYELAEAAGYELIIGNMYIGGCDLDKHCLLYTSPRDIYHHHLPELKQLMQAGLGKHNVPDNQRFNEPNKLSGRYRLARKVFRHSRKPSRSYRRMAP